MARGSFRFLHMTITSIKYISDTETGHRKNNEDSLLTCELGESLYALAVADGMGGMDAGEVASGLAISAAFHSLKENTEELLNKTKSLKDAVTAAFLAAQTHIADDIIETPRRAGMGTTLVLILIHKNRYVIGNMGDSRLYLHRRERLKLLTNDHSYIFEEQEKNGKNLSIELINRYGHLVTRILDGNKQEVDLYPKHRKSFRLRKKDGLLLCSDGLITPEVFNDPTKMESVLNKMLNRETFTKDLINWAMNAGSKDNITLIYACPNTNLNI